jgi:hypothetical protein
VVLPILLITNGCTPDLVTADWSIPGVLFSEHIYRFQVRFEPTASSASAPTSV